MDSMKKVTQIQEERGLKWGPEYVPEKKCYKSTK
jgi:hypothetical protein